MKRLVSLLLSVVMLLTMTVSVLAEVPTVSPAGDELYAESGEMIKSELYAALRTLYEGINLTDLANSAAIEEAGISNRKSVTCDSVIDEETICYYLDEELIEDSEESYTLTTGEHTATVSFNYHADYSYKTSTYSLKRYYGSLDTAFHGGEKKFTFSIRLKTQLSLKKTTAFLSYGDENAEATVLSQIAPSVSASDYNTVQDAELSFSEKLSSLEAGEYTVSVLYDGIADRGFDDGIGYQPCEAEFKLYVLKSSSTIKIDDSIVTYDGSEHFINVTVDPEDIPYTAITVGLQGDAEGFASIYMSEGNALYNTLVSLRNVNDTVMWFASMFGIDLSSFLIGSEGVSLEQLRNVLTSITEINEFLSGLGGQQVEESQISGILEALSAIEKIMPDLNVRFYIKNMPKNEGLYITYAVAMDDNHNPAIDFGYTTIVPSFKASIKWADSLKDNNFIFTTDNIADFDFSAYMVEQTGEEEERRVDKEVKYTITGMTTGGKLFSSDSLENLPTQPGVYTQTAYSLFNYVTAQSRTFSIAKDDPKVLFLGENGAYVDTMTMNITTAESKPVTAVVLDKNGEKIEDAKITYTYSGKTDAGKTYLSTNAPTVSGTYTVKAIFSGNDLYNAASNDGATLTVKKAKASITFDNVNVKIFKTVDLSGVGYTFEGMTEEEAAAIAATLKPSLKVYLLIGTYHTSVSIPSDISEKYDVTVKLGKIYAKL